MVRVMNADSGRAVLLVTEYAIRGFSSQHWLQKWAAQRTKYLLSTFRLDRDVGVTVPVNY